MALHLPLRFYLAKSQFLSTRSIFNLYLFVLSTRTHCASRNSTTMAENENCMRMTRAAARKRAAMKAAAEDKPASKKRVVLGELPNVSNAVILVKSENKTQEKKKVNKAKKALAVPPPVMTANEMGAEQNTGNDMMSDPQMCGPYVTDIYEYLHSMEVKPSRIPLSDYMEKVQKVITPNMRGVLVDWLVEVAEEYKLESDTLYLTVAYIDRFLSLNYITRNRLQLLGVSAMLVASKYEEIHPPNVNDFCYITDNTYTPQEVVKMEADILKSLTYELGNPTIRTFLRRFTRVALEDIKTSHLQIEFMGCYLSELSLLEYKCLRFLPSLVAASALFLARFIIRPKTHPWNLTLQDYTKYKPADLKECVRILHDLYLSRRGAVLRALREKYKQHKFKCVATMPSPPEVHASYFEDLTL